MRFRTRLAVWITLIMSLVYGIAGTLLIYLTFQKSIDMEKEKGMRSYQMLCSTLVLANNISKQSSIYDIAGIFSQLAAQGGDWSSLRLYQKEKILYEVGSIQFDKNLSDKCTETSCCMKIISECLTAETPSSDNANKGEANKLDRAYTDLLDMYLFYHQHSKTNFMQDDHELVYNAVNEYSKNYTLDKLFEKSKLFEYDSAKLDKAKQKEVG